MSFLIKGGFNAFRNHIIDITLIPTKFWNTGTICILENTKIKNIDSRIPNVIKQVKYTHKNQIGYALLLNNDLIYDSNKLFTYDVSLNLREENDYAITNMYSYIKYNCEEIL